MLEDIKWDEISNIRDIKNKDFFNVVYLHAFTGSYKNKLSIIDKLENCNFYGFDMPGHGNTPFNSLDELDVKYFAKLAIKYILDFDIDNIILMGHSMGGGIALMIANNELIKNRIKKIILESPANPASKTHYEIIEKLIPETFSDMEMIGSQLFYDPVTFFRSIQGYNRFLNVEFNRLKQKTYLKKIIDLKNQEMFNELIFYNINKISIDCLLILGEDDLIIPYKETKAIFEKNKHFQIEKIKNAKHVPIAEKSVECLKLINKFISK